MSEGHDRRRRSTTTRTWTLNLPAAGLLLGLSLWAASAAGSEAPPAAPPAAEAPADAAPAEATEEIRLADELVLRPLAPGLWLHVSTFPIDGRPVAANGLVVAGAGGALLLDTPWTAELTARLLDWIGGELGVPVLGVVATHFHADAAGGLAAAHERGIPTYGSRRTAELAAGRGEPAPRTTFADRLPFAAGGIAAELYFPGPGHSPDNVAVWLPEQRALFGGCLVKSAEASGPGNLADADLAAWPAALGRLRERYPETALIVPGHGRPGGWELLDNTHRLVVAAAASGSPE